MEEICLATPTHDSQCSNATCCLSYLISIPFLLMPWQLKDPEHQQAWYWPNDPEHSISNIRRVDMLWYSLSKELIKKTPHSLPIFCEFMVWRKLWLSQCHIVFNTALYLTSISIEHCKDLIPFSISRWSKWQVILSHNVNKIIILCNKLIAKHVFLMIWWCLSAKLIDLQYSYNIIMSVMASQITSLTIVLHLFRPRSKKTSKLYVTGPLCREFTGEFPAQRASDAENVSISWHHVYQLIKAVKLIGISE